MAQVFVSYKHDMQPDVQLAGGIAAALRAQGHGVFIDSQILIGQEWPAVIEKELNSAEYLVVLLSEAAASSEMIVKEVEIAHRLRKNSGLPRLLPVRIAYEAALPYDLGAWLDRIQYALWRNDQDDQSIYAGILAAISSQQPETAASGSVAPMELSADGNAVAAGACLSAPLPTFDPRWLEMLEDPTGAVRLKSPFYVERALDTSIREQVVKSGVTVRLKGARQTGKSSALARIYQYLRDRKQPVLYVDFQRLDEKHTADLDSLLHYLAGFVALRLKTNQGAGTYWGSELGAKDNLTSFIEEQVLEQVDTPVVLILDEVDRLFGYHYQDDFFGLVRSWHSNRAFDDRWDRLNLLLTYSTEASLLIQDDAQSPFNVGEAFETLDFDLDQVKLLNFKHGSPIGVQADLDFLMELLEGHPFLVRRALYGLARGKFNFAGLRAAAADDDGPFSDHLHYYSWWLKDRPELKAELRGALQSQSCATDQGFYVLRSAGLIRGHKREKVAARCGLYSAYFGSRL
jgi:hypothetical protein